MVGVVGRVGIVDIKGSRKDIAYSVWKNIIYRCYDSKTQAKTPTYIGCTVCDEWLNYSNFKKWFEDNYVEGYQIDKDILSVNTKKYSPDTCCMVPFEINYLLCNAANIRGEYPIGVGFHKASGKYRAYLSVKNRQVSLGYFDSIEHASKAYFIAKARNIEDTANRSFACGRINNACYLGLLRIANEMKGDI